MPKRPRLPRLLCALCSLAILLPASRAIPEPEVPTVVTAWWLIFNQPERCEGSTTLEGRCSIAPVETPPRLEDIFLADGCLMHATGALAAPDQIVRLVASLSAADLVDDATNPCIWGSAGLLDPMSAEVHLLVRSNGPRLDDPERLLDQLTAYEGGCPAGPNGGPNRCVDLQSALHTPCEAASQICDPHRSDGPVLWLGEPFLERAGLDAGSAHHLALEKAGRSTLYRGEQGLTMVIETSLGSFPTVRASAAD